LEILIVESHKFFSEMNPVIPHWYFFRTVHWYVQRAVGKKFKILQIH